MEALSVGMYVRTKKGIAKIKKIFPDGSEPYYEAKYETDTYLEIYYDSQYVSEDDVLKANYNIINILEVGDYVNGQIVTQIIPNNRKKEPSTMIYTGINYYVGLYDENIKSIVTKESMESVTYYVK